MAFCTKCGNQIPDDSAFCTSCGQPTGVNQNQQQNNAAPSFTPPTNNNNVSNFTPPTGNAQPANNNSSAPTFNPPAENKGAPTFTPPAAPTFTPPAQTFTPPSRSFNGPSCYYHTNEPAVASCARCGKYLCQDCFDSYGVSGGEYAGKALCYDCSQELVADNVAELTANKATIKRQFILSIVGMSIGFILGFSMVVGQGGFGAALLEGLICAAIGGVFLSAIKAYFSMLWETIKAAFSHGIIVAMIMAFVWSIILVFKCIWTTISNTIYYIRYLKRTSNFIESDQAALQQMKEYMEYTMVRNKNRGVDIETLLQQNSQLANNSVAQMARNHSEEEIEAAMRNCVATINENGEIIRDFRAA